MKVTALLRHRGLWVNLFFIGYFALLQPLVQSRLEQVLERGQTYWLLGLILLAAPFLEMAGFYLKVPAMLARLQNNAVRWPDTLPALVWMAHLVLSLVLLFASFFALGLSSEANGGSVPPVGVIILGLVVIKEIWYLLYWVDKASTRPAGPVRPVRPGRFARFLSGGAAPETVELVGDLLLMPFATLGFTSAWFMLLGSRPIHISAPGDALVELGVATFTFMLIFFAARSIYLIEEWASLRGCLPLVVWAGSILLNLLLTLASLPRI